MAETLRTTDQLKQLFARYPAIGEALAGAKANTARINTLNAEGGGNGQDDASQQYQETISTGMPPLTDVLSLLDTLVNQVGVDGQEAMKIFDRAESEAQEFANSWQSEGPA